ncbi:MAG: nucleotide exchange factor GrpE [Candidatus Nanopelagicales bacterium]|nr:nucleotide exchange factor GrpE [Candidatus Nanopelagicales bacterium]
MTESSPDNHDEAADGVRITDKRRIDPETGALSEPAPASEADAATEAVQGEIIEVENGEVLSEDVEDAAETAGAQARVAELTGDLQRITAEYANYRKRVDRDRELNRALAVGAVLNELLPVLDDIDRARQHDELTGAFKSVGEALEATTTRLGLTRYGVAGDRFDPELHEALTQAPLPEGIVAAEDPDAGTPAGPVCSQIFEPGYRLNDRVIRPARVAVTE